jgi:hypothetical protein
MVIIPHGVPGPWLWVVELSLLVLLIFVVDATITLLRRKDRPRGVAQIGAHLRDAGTQPQRPQRRQEDLSGEVLGVGLVADPGVYGAVHPGRVVLVDGFPVRVAIIRRHHPKGARLRWIA